MGCSSLLHDVTAGEFPSTVASSDGPDVDDVGDAVGPVLVTVTSLLMVVGPNFCSASERVVDVVVLEPRRDPRLLLEGPHLPCQRPTRGRQDELDHAAPPEGGLAD